MFFSASNCVIPHRARLWSLLGILCLSLFITGCSKDVRDLQSGAEELFKLGNKSMKSGNYQNAITYFETLEARYPFSNQAKQAQLNLIYTYYKNQDPEAVVDAATQFERENPIHPRVDYALYMRGLAYFPPEHKGYHRLLRIDLAKRPPVEVRESFSVFARLVQRYPESIYTEDAKQRMVFLRNRLAKHETLVADYYFRRGAYVAALNRAKFTTVNYEGAPAVADAMYIMVASYEKLGMQDLAAETRGVLNQNYPKTKKPQTVKKKRFYFF